MFLNFNGSDEEAGFCVRDCSGNPFLFFGGGKRKEKNKKDCNEKPDLKEEIGASEASADFPTEGYAHISTSLNVEMNFILGNYLFIFGALQKLGLTGFDSKING